MMLEALITSKTRIKLLLKFFLNSNNKGWLRSLESEFGESTNAIRLELNRFQNAGLLISQNEGNKKIYKANTEHPLFHEINHIVIKHIGLDKVVDKIIMSLGELDSVYLVGELAKGNNSNLIDLWFVGEQIDKSYLLTLTEKAEQVINRKIRYVVINQSELHDLTKQKSNTELLLLWTAT